MEPLEHARHSFLQALQCQQAGDWSGAERLYRQALALAPDRVSVLVNLGAVLIQQQRHADALRLCERALALEPAHPDAAQNAALCRRQLYGDSDAVATLDRVLAQHPTDVQALNNRGVSLRHHGRWQDALQDFDRALALQPGEVGVLANRASVLAELGRGAEALQDFASALHRDPNFLPAQQGLFDLLAHEPVLGSDADAAIEALALRAANEPWGRPQALAPFLLARLRATVMPRERDADDFDAATLGSVAASAVLRTLLQQGLIPDTALEQRLSVLRSQLLQAAVGHESATFVAPELLSLHCALARQAFINEYLVPPAPPDLAAVAALRRRLDEALLRGGAIVPTWLAAVASQEPLSRLPQMESLLARDWPEPVQALLRQQVQEPAIERELASGIGSLTPIEDPTSQRVRAQYETHPYPRWVALPRRREPQTLAAYLANRLPDLRAEELPRGRRIAALVAGSGTGQQPIETAQALPEIEVLAIDLSLASLAYAKRMARTLGLANLRFAQADLLDFGRSGLRFELIESSGVLHHLAEPARGLAALAGLLQPGGLMRLGLYSEQARRAVVAARAHIAARGYRADLAGIRACRRDILAAPLDSPLRGVLAFRDFHSLSECRDLLFHVQELRFTLPQLAELLRAQRLRLLGFELEPAARRAFAAMFPDPAARRDFAAWDRFEAAHPDTFAAMYQFWVRASD